MTRRNSPGFGPRSSIGSRECNRKNNTYAHGDLFKVMSYIGSTILCNRSLVILKCKLAKMFKFWLDQQRHLPTIYFYSEGRYNALLILQYSRFICTSDILIDSKLQGVITWTVGLGGSMVTVTLRSGWSMKVNWWRQDFNRSTNQNSVRHQNRSSWYFVNNC